MNHRLGTTASEVSKGFPKLIVVSFRFPEIPKELPKSLYGILVCLEVFSLEWLIEVLKGFIMILRGSQTVFKILKVAQELK